MKLCLILISLVAVLGRCRGDGRATSLVSYSNNEWTGFIECNFPGSLLCDQSISLEGQRIDTNHHDPSQTVFQTCYQDQNTIGLIVNGFSYDDVNHYTCLSGGSNSWNTASTWLWALPILDADVPVTSRVGDEFTFTCTSYSGTPLYWVLPGRQDSHWDANVTHYDNEINSTSHLHFTLAESDVYGEFWCCAEEKPNQETISPCVSYTVYIYEPPLITSTVDFRDDSDWSLQCQIQGYPELSEISWHKCNYDDICTTIPSPSVHDNLHHIVTSNLTIEPTSEFYYSCMAFNTEGSVAYIFYPMAGYYTPEVNITDKTFYSTGDDNYAFQLKCVVKAVPEPQISWNVQNFWDESFGYETYTPDQPGPYKIANAKVGSDMYYSTLVIENYDADRDQGTFACIADCGDTGKGVQETQAQIGPDSVAMYPCGGNYHEIGDKVSVVLVSSGFPPPRYDITVVSEMSVDYNISETYISNLGINVVTTSFHLQTAHVQLTGSVFFPYVLFTNNFVVDIYSSDVYPSSTPKPSTSTTHGGSTTHSGTTSTDYWDTTTYRYTTTPYWYTTTPDWYGSSSTHSPTTSTTTKNTSTGTTTLPSLFCPTN